MDPDDLIQVNENRPTKENPLPYGWPLVNNRPL